MRAACEDYVVCGGAVVPSGENKSTNKTYMLTGPETYRCPGVPDPCGAWIDAGL